jgi:hypothetical protein
MADTQSDIEAMDLMTKYEITRIPADQFRYKTFRYSNLSDAVSQARRDQIR